MAALIAFIRNWPTWVLAGVAATAIVAQEASPVPFWPEDNRLPAKSSEQYVFLTPDKHTIVVLAPENPETGINGPKKIVRVPIRNDLAPSVSVQTAKTPAGKFTYKYTIENRAGAGDAIGAFTLIVPPGDASLEVRHLASNGKDSWSGTAAHGPLAHVAIARQAIFPNAKPGRFLLWFQQGANVIHPGGTLAGFEIQSSYMPGLTTAWFSSGELVDFDQSWPREIFKQLELLEDRRYREVYAITIGPMFSPETAKPEIVEVLQQQLADMVKAGLLDRHSAFAEEAVKILREFHRNPDELPTLKSRPQNTVEVAIAIALRETVGVR